MSLFIQRPWSQKQLKRNREIEQKKCMIKKKPKTKLLENRKVQKTVKKSKKDQNNIK